MKHINIRTTSIALFLWGIIVMILTRQVPLTSFSIIGNFAILGLSIYTISNLKKSETKNVVYILLFTFTLVAYAFLMGNDFSVIMRFFLIIFFVLIAYFVKLPANKALKILFYLSLLQALLLIILELLLLFVFDDAIYLAIRAYALSNEWGSIYSSGMVYKIQIKGNQILPFVYMLSWVTNVFPVKFKRVFQLIFLLAIFSAGNFAFILGLFTFHFIWFFWDIRKKVQLQNKMIIFFVALLVLSLPLLTYLNDMIEKKSHYSNAVRIEQTDALMSDLTQNSVTFIFGQGLGRSINYSGIFRDYDGDLYFELQTLFFINQLGLVGFTVFLILNTLFAKRYIKDSKLIIVYLCYILYAFFNPYIIDTTHVVVIISLIAARKLNNENNENNLCSRTL